MRIKSIIITLFTCMSVHVNAQNILEQILSGLAQGANAALESSTLNKIINNPSMQSTDMKNYLSSYRKGDEYASAGDYMNAAECYCGAWLTATRTKDNALKTLWTKYGWMKDTKSKIESACSLAGIENPFAVTYNQQVGGGTVGSGMSNSYSSGSSSSSSSSHVCRLCNGTGRKIVEHYAAGERKFCNECNARRSAGHSHVFCDLCSGKGVCSY